MIKSTPKTVSNPSHLLWNRPSPRAILEIEPLRGRARWLVFLFDKAHPPSYNAIVGRVAQLVERFPYTEEVTGSSPVSPIG